MTLGDVVMGLLAPALRVVFIAIVAGITALSALSTTSRPALAGLGVWGSRSGSA